ncbi:MAG: DUF1553 domain-containing protein [Phycisphaera sp.]|nr:DUF1553 domain-containing protein [Phycisphaera sp.]
MTYAAVALVPTPVCAGEPRTPVDFERDVQPILSEHCYHCHGPDDKAREAKLRLDTKAGAFKDMGGYKVIVPGKPDDSELYYRVSTTKADDIMPPPKAKIPLKPAQIDVLRRWIEQGAPWAAHWSFVPPRVGELPEVRDAKWPRNPIDRFIESRLEREGLRHSPEADRITLIRRVTLDLTGLPPTPEEVDAFVADRSPDAYEKLVDRLLASPRYGERMVWEWLDAARYADSNGYQADPERTMWPWRDWVINAMNANMPFDEFTIEQLGGDLLPNATLEQKIATGFNRNHMYNGEGGRIAEETRVENVMDRTETVGTVWLGLTMTCCRCHNHKFDPVTNAEYYQLYAFFNNTSENGGKYGSGQIPPVVSMPTDAQKERLAAAEMKVKALREKLKELEPKLDAEQTAWEQARREHGDRPLWSALDFDKLLSTNGAKITKRDDLAVHVTGYRPEKDIYELTAHTDATGIVAFRLDALLDDQSPAKNVGRDEQGNFVLSEIELYVRPANDPNAEPKRVMFAKAAADHSQAGFPVERAIDGKVDAANNGWAVDGHVRREPCVGVFVTSEPVGFEGGTELQFRLRFESQHTHHTLALFRISETADRSVVNEPLKATSGVDPAVAKILELPVDKRDNKQRKAARDYFRDNVSKDSGPLAAELNKAELAQDNIGKEANAIKVMVMDELPADKRRTTAILAKGAYDKPGEVVHEGTPAILPPLASDDRPTRLDLARWLVRPDHPLTARVTVNRYWQQFFGTGLVKTTEDFGTQGERPSHPELLDWLASEFIRSGWDVKHMHKLIVTSATYRQSSRVDSELLERDPHNRLLARAPRYRMPSWMLRDQALFVSGLMTEKLGGPPVMPYQPKGIWAEATFGKKHYTQDPGDKLYRRSVYTFWRRIVGPPVFFDVAKRQTCEVKVARTNSPLHALVTMNDVTYVEAARAMAQRVLQTAGEDPTQRATLAFRLVASRKPSAAELDVMTGRVDELRRQYAGDAKAAKELLAVGDSPRDEKLDPVEHAAYTGLCLMLLNLDETLTKE